MELQTFFYILIFSLLGGVLSLLAGAILLGRRKWAEKLANYATPFAAGALLGAVFLDLLKEGIEQADEAYTVLLFCLVGIIIFFFAERFLRWFHHHHEGEDEAATKSLIIVGDTLHNALDGVAIAASFLVSIPTGIVTTIAVAAHEIPQEIADFGILLNKGMSRRQVLVVNVLSALATTAAALITFFLGGGEAVPLGILLGLSAGFLLYIAMSDLIPTIHQHTSNGKRRKLFDWQPLLLLLGVIIVGISVNIAHKYIDENHNEEETVQPAEASTEE